MRRSLRAATLLMISATCLTCLTGCEKKNASHTTTAAAVATVPAGVRCTADPSFPADFEIAEASAAAEVALTPGARELLVVADSGHHGKALAWRIPAGPSRTLRVTVDSAASDDVEGMAWQDGHLFTLTSAGAMRRYSPDGAGGLEADGESYRIGAPPLSCAEITDSNCGKDYEGLCLRGAATDAHCVGYAASKDKSALFCLVREGDRLVVDAARPRVPLKLPKHALSDCAFGAAGGPAAGVLVVTTNERDGSATYVVDEATGGLTRLAIAGTSANEAVAIDREGALYVFEDSHTKRSRGLRFTCNGW